MPLVGIALLSLTKVCQCGQHNGREQGGALEERLTSSEVSLVLRGGRRGGASTRIVLIPECKMLLEVHLRQTHG